jgi:hypothetical protein
MPRMDWKDFEHDHHRPHLMIVSMEAKEKAKLSLAEADFERLAVTLRASGNYAIKMEGTAIYVAFEDDADAERFAAVLRPMETSRDSEWASKAFVRMDDAAYRRVTALLKKARSTAKRREPTPR